MSKEKIDEVRENRIIMEVVVDAYDEEERAMGWYYYLDDKLRFPFQAECIAERKISPLSVHDKVTVTGMAPADECLHEVFVEIHWAGKELASPLSQLNPIEADTDTQEAIEDWHYWVEKGYQY
jgi:Calcium binding